MHSNEKNTKNVLHILRNTTLNYLTVYTTVLKAVYMLVNIIIMFVVQKVTDARFPDPYLLCFLKLLQVIIIQQVLTVILCHDGTQRTKLYNVLYNIEKTSYIIIYDHLRSLMKLFFRFSNKNHEQIVFSPFCETENVIDFGRYKTATANRYEHNINL